MNKKTETKIQTGKYRHYKGGIVEVLGVAHHSETLEEFVLYRALYECRDCGIGSVWVRPLKMFFENVVVDGKAKPRFEYLEG